MAKNSVSDWDTTAGNNTDVGNVGIAGSSSIRLGDNAIREMMAQIKTWTETGGSASQAEQEAGSITNKFVTPGRQQFHPSAAKCWVVFDSTSSVAAASYNLASMSDGGTGSSTINIGTDFSSGVYVAVATAEALGAVIHVYATTTNAGSCTVSQFNNAGSNAEGTGAISVVMFGDQ